MARITNALLDQRAFGRHAHQPMLDLTYGGQHGYAPNLAEWVSNQAYIQKNVCAILLEAPKFFQLMPEPQKWVEVLRSLFEVHARSIEGLAGGLVVDTDDHPVGGAGEIQQEFTDVKRTRSAPSITWTEKYGLPIQTFLQHWIQYGLMDPDTKYALIGTLGDQAPEDMLADWYTATVLFYEPDPTHRKVIKSWICTNMFPLSNGEVTGTRDLTSAKSVTNLSVEFTALTMFNMGTNVFAQSILDRINFTNANPHLRQSFIQNINEHVQATTEGYQKSVENLAAEAVVTAVG